MTSGRNFLKTSLAPRSLYPAGAAFMARASASELKMLGLPASVVDTITTSLMGALNGLPTIRHRAGVTPLILDILARSGIEVDEEMRLYVEPDEAERHAHELVGEGYKLFWPYPPEARRFSDEAHLVSPALWKHLNAKRNLHELAPKENLASRRMEPPEVVAELTLETPVFLKAAGEDATGNGYAVRHCATKADLEAALEHFKSLGPTEELIVEEAVDVIGTWCVSLAIDEEGVRFVGAAEQIFDAPGHQIGNVIDPDRPFAEAGIGLALKVGEAARVKGFRGAAGMDIGVTPEGRAVVFDPNFRSQASTLLSLFHGAAAARSGLAAGRSFNCRSKLGIDEVERILRDPIDKGWFVANRLIDGALMPSLGVPALVTGFVLAGSREAAEQRFREIEAKLS